MDLVGGEEKRKERKGGGREISSQHCKCYVFLMKKDAFLD